MTPVKKIRNACFLACVESFLADHGIQLKQDSMIKILKCAGLCSDDGVVNRGHEKDACLKLDIHFSDVRFHYPIDPIYTDGSLLIGTTTTTNHCVRFYKQEEENKIIIMDPENGGFFYWDKPSLERENPNYHRIELLKKPT